MELFQLQLNEPLLLEIQRIAIAKIDVSLNQLQDPHFDKDTAVHDARKTCKYLRAILRLMRDVIGYRAYQHLNLQFRDASRLFASSRESAVMVTTLDNLMVWQQTIPPPSFISPPHFAKSFVSLREQLLSRQKAVFDKTLESHIIFDFITAVSQARTHISGWKMTSNQIQIVASGIRRVYRRGRRAMAEAKAQPTDESLHEWRKHVKYLWHQIEIATPIWPEKCFELAENLHILSSLLGDDHDLADLYHLIGHNPQLQPTQEIQTTLFSLIQARRHDYQSAAWQLGQQLYQEKPGALINPLLKKLRY